MRITKKVVVDTFVCEYAWTCEVCSSEMEAEQADINCLNDGQTLRLYTACPVCSVTHFVDETKMSVASVSKAVAEAPIFIDPQVELQALKDAKIQADAEALAASSGVPVEDILNSVNSSQGVSVPLKV